jgi:hypothetical protein
VAARGQPLRGRRHHPPQDVEPVRTAVERQPRLVRAGLRGQQPDLLGGHVGHVGGQNVNAAAQRGGQRPVKVALVYPAVGSGDVAAGARHRRGVDVGRVQLHPAQGRGERGAHRARAAAQVDDDGPRPGGYRPPWAHPGPRWPGPPREGGGRADERDRLFDEELGPAAGHEDAGVNGYLQATELRPAEDVLERQARGAAVDHSGEVRRGPGRRDEQLRLVLGEDAAGGAEPGDDGRSIAR